jgi:hypothetical protein
VRPELRLLFACTSVRFLDSDKPFADRCLVKPAIEIAQRAINALRYGRIATPNEAISEEK